MERLLPYYERELAHLRRTLREQAQHFATLHAGLRLPTIRDSSRKMSYPRWGEALTAAFISLSLASQPAAAGQPSQAESSTEKIRSLELISLGATYEKYRQGKLLGALHEGSAFQSIRETDPAKYLWSEDDKSTQSGARGLDALENGGAHAPMYWGVPSMYAGSPDYRSAEPGEPVAGAVSGAEPTVWHGICLLQQSGP